MEILINREPKGTPECIKIEKSKNAMRFTLKVFTIQDGEHVVSYIPSLNMSGYGESEEKAMSMLYESISYYSEELRKLTIYQIKDELRKFGWEQKKFARKQYVHSAHVDKNGILKNFDLPEDTPVRESTLQLA